MPKEHQQVAVVDLDGTLAKYDRWRGADHFGEPVPGAREAIFEMHSWGWLIIVYTTRGNKASVEKWLDDHEIYFDEVNSFAHNPDGCSDKPIATVYFDDREANVVGCKWYPWRDAMGRVRRKFRSPEPFDDQWVNSGAD